MHRFIIYMTTHTHTDRQTDRHSYSLRESVHRFIIYMTTHTHTDRQTDRHSYSLRESEHNRIRQMTLYKHTNRQTDRQKDIHSFLQSVRLYTSTQTDRVCLLVGCLTSQQQASVSQGRMCSDNFTCRHTEIEVADPTFYLTQSQYT